MKPPTIAALLSSIVFLGAAGAAGAAPMSTVQASRAARDADFGHPPAGDFPIFFNDHTVYATPDVLKNNRVLAALVKGGHMYVPLRSMFEHMGATVNASLDGRTFTAAKPGSSASVTLGKSEVIVNGETRPLDVPPIVYRGIVLVPVRVLSEAMGAYVQWVPEKRVVVVRYIPTLPEPAPQATPVQTAPPTPARVVTPLVTPAPTATPPPYLNRGFVAAAFSAPKSYNEFSAGEWCPESYIVSAAYSFKNSPIAIKLDYRQDVYVTSDNLTDAFANHYTRFATIDRGFAQTPVFLARQSTLDARAEFQIAAPRIYAGVGYISTATNFGYPHLNGFGVGLEKLPDLQPGLNAFGSAFFYPSASGTYTVQDAASANFGTSYRQQFDILKYDVGLALVAKRFPVYLYGGFSGDRYTAKANAPISQTHDGPYLGLGVKL